MEFEFEDREARVRQGERSSELGPLPSFFEYPFVTGSTLALFNSARVRVAQLDRLFAVDGRPIARLDESTRWLEDSLRDGGFKIYETSPHARGAVGNSTPDSVRESAVAQFDVGGRGPLLLSQDHLEFLAQTVEVLGYAKASMRLDVVRVTPAAPERLEPAIHAYGRYEFRFVKRDGSRLSPEELSFGQQRLFAFLYYAAMHPHIVIVDELTNGMHHSMIERCLEVVRGRQTFLATQNPLLLDNLEFEDAEEVRRTFILCSNDEVDGQEQMVWRNMTVDEAENFTAITRSASRTSTTSCGAGACGSGRALGATAHRGYR
ncbi:AAA family ATPase [Nannocystis pusilla]|uniref:AAA family ATPase n=1 Tax=Nannocystis pusilla TaxID=889268 RepID=UPI0030B8287F